VVADFKIHDAGHRLFNFMNTGITVLFDLSANGANYVVVLFAEMGLLKLGDVFAELMFYHQTAIEQQLHRVVQSGSAHAVVVILHVDV